ncbi:MAG: PmoA family protein [Bacteroidetes bacterium]|nr:PmoA family protein [Bacteroidota bacterium]
MKKILVLAALCCFQIALAQKKVTFKDLDSEHKIEVKIGEKVFTNYYYPGKDVLKKAVLNPVFTPKGTEVTRGWPISPRKNERIDHPHHAGVWLNYEDANGHDFWNNSVEVEKSGDKRTFGTIIHTGIKTQKGGKKSGKLVVTADWLDKNGQLMLIEETTYIFSGNEKTNTVDRITTLTAADKNVIFKDVKDGLFAIRVARELEMPSNKPEMFTDASGLATKVPVLDNTGVSGNYLNAQGITGEDTWSKRSEWVTLQGKIENEDISVSIFDHPKNVNYPSYWHTRGYGLFSVNPLGEKVFTNGKKETNLTLEQGQSTTFRYRLAVSSTKLFPEELNEIAKDFNKRY